MTSHRKTSITVGVLFIAATALNVLGKTVCIDPILKAPDYLARASTSQSQLILGALIILLSVLVSACIAIWLYPVLKRHHGALALGSVGFRLIESLLYFVGVVCLLSLLTLSREYIRAGASSAYLFHVSGTTLLAIKDWAGQLSVIAFTVGAMMYYAVFYRSRLVPRWLSAWGLLAAVASLAAILLTMCGQIAPFSTVFILLQLPIGLQEYTLAVWLIVKGFNPSAIASPSAGTATN